MSDFRQFSKENPSKIKKILILISVEKTFICIFQRETHQRYKKIMLTTKKDARTNEHD